MNNQGLAGRRNALSEAKQALLEKRIRGARAGAVRTQVPRRAEGGPAPLSFGQQRFWFLEQLAPGNVSSHMGGAARLEGLLDVPLLERCLNEIVRRHETLRTALVEIDNEPRQVVRDAVTAVLVVESLEAVAEEERDAALEARLLEIFQQPFDLTAGAPLRTRLFRLAPTEHALLLVIHHAFSDAWSQGVMVEELFRRYEGAVTGREVPIPELAIQYGDYAAWQRERLEGEQLDAQMRWWMERLAGRPYTELPLDRPRPPVQTFAGRRLVDAYGPLLTPRLHERAKEEKASLFMLLVSAIAIMLHKSTDEEDVLFGCAYHGRSLVELEPLIGIFINTLIMRPDLSGDPTLREIVARMRTFALDAFANSDLPFDRRVEQINPERDLSRTPIFQIMMALQNVPIPRVELTTLRVSPVIIDTGATGFDMELRFGETREGLECRLSYNTNLFEEATGKRLVGQLRRILEALADKPEMRLGELELLAGPERRQVREDWGVAQAAPPAGATVPERVAAIAAAHPEAVAVVGADGKQLSYGELSARADRLARRLRALGAGPGARVGIYLGRSPRLVEALLGVLRSGAAYVPIDPAYPPDRVAYMLEDSDAVALVSDSTLAPALSAWSKPLIRIDAPETADDLPDLPPPPSLDDIAYVIYTSGSTGRPKGVEIPHRGLLNLIEWHNRRYGLTPADRTTQIASPAFDASVWEIWPTLVAGAALHMPGEAERSDPARLWAWLAERAITVSFLPTPLAEAALALPLPGGLVLRSLLTGGDKLRQAPARPLPFELVNHYGPTENSVVSTCGAVGRGGAGAPSCGRPSHNVVARVLDRNLRPVAIGAPGELCVGGPGLARGYLNRPELTAELFVTDPRDGLRLYRTGDKVRWRNDGRLEFMGRIDDQVKIRGFRIEPGEIEAALARQPGIAAAAAGARTDPGGEARLVAWVEPANGTADIEAWRAALAAQLPEYMVPSHFVVLERLPLSPNGKIARRALPAPDFGATAGLDETPPRDATEESVAAVWRDVLGLASVGVHANFFEVGGHSLRATQLVSRLRESFGLELPLRMVFEAPTVAAQARAIEALRWAREGQSSAATAGEVLEEIEL